MLVAFSISPAHRCSAPRPASPPVRSARRRTCPRGSHHAPCDPYPGGTSGPDAQWVRRSRCEITGGVGEVRDAPHGHRRQPSTPITAAASIRLPMPAGIGREARASSRPSAPASTGPAAQRPRRAYCSGPRFLCDGAADRRRQARAHSDGVDDVTADADAEGPHRAVPLPADVPAARRQRRSSSTRRRAAGRPSSRASGR